MPLLSLHRITALVLIIFSLAHVGNHLVSLLSVAAHIRLMEALRTIYRYPLIEPLLLTCVLVQIISGIKLVVRGWAKRQGRIAWLQALSGSYIALFLPIHVGAVLFGRMALGLDTNFYFAAVGFHMPPWEWFFAPYYTLAVLALFVHFGCALYWRLYDSALVWAKLGLTCAIQVGLLTSVTIVLSLAGKVQPVEIPAAYKASCTRCIVLRI
jgi:hypothetical protein